MSTDNNYPDHSSFENGLDRIMDVIFPNTGFTALDAVDLLKVHGSEYRNRVSAKVESLGSIVNQAAIYYCCGSDTDPSEREDMLALAAGADTRDYDLKRGKRLMGVIAVVGVAASQAL